MRDKLPKSIGVWKAVIDLDGDRIIRGWVELFFVPTQGKWIQIPGITRYVSRDGEIYDC